MRRCWRTSPWELSHSLSTNRGSPRTSAQIITMFADRGTRHWVLSCRAQWTILPNDFAVAKYRGEALKLPDVGCIGRSALPQQWAAPPIKAQSICKFGVCDCLDKNNIRKISQEKTPDSSYRQCRRTPTYLRERIAPPWLLSQDSISSVLLKLKCLAIPNLCKTKLQSLVWQIAKLIHFFWNFNVSCYL